MSKIVSMKGKEIKILTAKEVWEKLEQEDRTKSGRIPSYLGHFELEGKQVDFDEDILDGGYYRGVAHVITGFPNHGKTSVALQSATVQAERGFKVLYISMEQDDLQVIEKVLGTLSGKPYKEWEEVKFMHKDDFETKKAKGLEILHAYLGDDLSIVFDSFNIDQMIHFVKEVVSDFDIIYCDNFQNCYYNSSKGRTEEFDRLSNTIRGILAGTKTAFVWLSQLSSDGGGKDPKKAHTKWSNKLVEDVATWILVHRPPVSGNTPKDVAKSYIDVGKNRKGKNGINFQDGIFVYNTVKGRLGSFDIQENVTKRLAERYEKERQLSPEDARDAAEKFFESLKPKEKDVWAEMSEIGQQEDDFGSEDGRDIDLDDFFTGDYQS